jgi:hypothetical protein
MNEDDPRVLEPSGALRLTDKACPVWGSSAQRCLYLLAMRFGQGEDLGEAVRRFHQAGNDLSDGTCRKVAWEVER